MKKQSLLIGMGILALTTPVILAVSCGSGETTTPPAKTDEELAREKIEAANLEKQRVISETNAKIDDFANNIRLEPTLTESGEKLAPDELVAATLSSVFKPFQQWTGYSANYQDLDVFVDHLTKGVGQTVVATISVSSNIEGAKTATYDVILNISNTTSNISEADQAHANAIASAKNALALAEGEKKIEPNSLYAPITKVGTIDALPASEIDWLGSDFTKQTNSAGLEFEVNGVDLNPGISNKISLNVYVYSNILHDEFLTDNTTKYETTFKVLVDKVVTQADIQGAKYTALNKATDMPHNGVTWKNGIALMSQGQALSMLFDVAKRLGWDGHDVFENTITNVPQPLTDSLDNIQTMPHVVDDAFLDQYFTASKDSLNSIHSDPKWTLAERDQDITQYAYTNMDPYLEPTAQQGRENGSLRPWIAAQSGGINIASGFTEYAAKTEGAHVNSRAGHSAYTPNAEDMRLNSPYNMSQISTWTDSEEPGVVYSEITINEGSSIMVANHIERIYKSEPNFIRTYNVISLKEQEKYIMILNSIFDKISGMVQRTGAAMNSAEQFMDDDIISAVEYISDKSSTITRLEIANLFDEMNNGTYYWPAIEVFYRGITGLTYADYQEGLKMGTKTIPGFQSLDKLTGLSAFFKFSDNWVDYEEPTL